MGDRASSRGSTTVIIPTRYGSSRFPGKPLATLCGKPMIQHVYERVAQTPGIDRVLVATDDERILRAVTRFGGDARLVDGPFRTGTDRVAAVASDLPGEVFVNLQGDEIALDARLLADLVEPFRASDAAMGTLKRRLTSWNEVENTGVVKVVTDQQGDALYFSRSPIPHLRDGRPEAPPSNLYFIHLGVYIFTREALVRFASLPTGVLEETEKLEQLRALEHGLRIRVWETTHASLRIDTSEDLAEAERQLIGDPLLHCTLIPEALHE